jgi:nucleotide-binding universal stress UspA family protein
MKKILVPTDFSHNATKAIYYAVAIAEKANAEIILLNVTTLLDTAFSSRKALIEEYNNTRVEGISEQLKELQQSIAVNNATVKLTTKLYKGEIQESILQCAADENADLIIMGTQGASGLKRIFIGSTTAGIIGNTTVPVLAIPREAMWKGLKNILFATRQLEADDKILTPVLKLAPLDAALIHVAVFTDTDDNDAGDYMEHGRLLNTYRQTLPARYSDINFKTVQLEGEEFDDTIEQYINDNKIDMLVMTTHKRSFWGNVFNSSMTEEMSYHINIPLLGIPV